MTTPEPSPDGMRRAELVDRAQAGDVGAFGELYDEYSLTVYRYIYARVSSSALAEDLTSETFVRRCAHWTRSAGKAGISVPGW